MELPSELLVGSKPSITCKKVNPKISIQKTSIMEEAEKTIYRLPGSNPASNRKRCSVIILNLARAAVLIKIFCILIGCLLGRSHRFFVTIEVSFCTVMMSPEMFSRGVIKRRWRVLKLLLRCQTFFLIKQIAPFASATKTCLMII